MRELVYLLKVGSGAGAAVKERLGGDTSPSHVRIATLAPLSNYGYPQGAEGAVLGMSTHGVVIGVEGSTEVPRAFVPWQNVAYLADAAGLTAAG